jgi:outer membrane protein TolC
MKITGIINTEFLFAQRREDAKKCLSALAPLWQKYLMPMLCSFIFSNIFLSIPGYSQSDSLQKYMVIAAVNNPAVQQRISEYEAALKKIPQVSSLSDPELSIGVYTTAMSLVDGMQVADLKLMQMFPWFGVLKNAKDEMSLMAKAKLELVRDTKLQVVYDVQRTWFDLYKLQKNIDISEKNIEILKTIERLAITKYSSIPSSNSSSTTSSPPVSPQVNNTGSQGMQTMGNSNSLPSSSNQSAVTMQGNSMGTASGSTSLSDIYRIQIETGDLENSIALLKNQKNTIIALFNSLLNRPSTSPIAAAGKLAPDSLDLSINSIADSITLKSPMLGMLQYEKESSEARKKMVTAMGYPMIGLGLNYSVLKKTDKPMGLPEMNGKDMIMPMVVVTLPIYRKKYKAMQDEADLSATATLQSYQSTSNSLQVEYYQAVQLYQDAQRRIKLYANQFQLASKSLDLTLNRFSVSASELSDVLRLRQQTLDYEFKQVEAVADFNTAIAWLRRLMAFSQIN